MRISPEARKTTSAAPSIADLQKRVDVLTRELKETRDQRSATTEVLRIINSQPGSLAPVFDAILQKAHALCGADDGSLQIYDGEHVRAVAVHGVTERFAKLLRDGLSAFKSPAARASFEGQRYIQINDARETTHTILRAAAELTGTRTILYMPLRMEDRLVGFIAAARREVKPFTENEIGLLENFAAQAVVAMENARLFNEVQEALERQTATGDILKVIARSPTNVQPVFDAIVNCAAKLFEPCSATITTLKDGKLHWNAIASRLPGFDPEGAKAIYPIPLDPDRAPSARAMLERRIIEIPDSTAPDVPEFTRKAAAAGGFRSCTFVPLLHQDTSIGTIILINPQAGFRLSEKQLALVKTFADQAVIAIQNARLFNEVQAKTRVVEESLQQQTATADVLKIISRSAFDLEPALVAICETAGRLCEADQAAIFTREGDGYRFAASFGFPPEYAADWRRAGPRAADPNSPLPGVRSIVERRPVHILDIAADPAFHQTSSRQSQARTALGIPLLRDGEPVGNFVLARRRVEAFTDRQIELVQTFADQAVIAIENARLFNEVQASTRDLQESLRQQTATADLLQVISRSAFDLQPIFDAIAERAVTLCGADRAFIFRFDGELLRMAAAYNAPPDFREWVAQHPIRPGRHSASARAALERRTIHIHDVRVDTEYTYGAKDAEDIRTVLGVPILKGDELLGVMMIYHLEGVRPFTEKQIALVETFADQAVIAIENARLFNETKEALERQTATGGRAQGHQPLIGRP